MYVHAGDVGSIFHAAVIFDFVMQYEIRQALKYVKKWERYLFFWVGERNIFKL